MRRWTAYRDPKTSAGGDTSDKRSQEERRIESAEALSVSVPPGLHSFPRDRRAGHMATRQTTTRNGNSTLAAAESDRHTPSPPPATQEESLSTEGQLQKIASRVRRDQKVWPAELLPPIGTHHWPQIDQPERQAEDSMMTKANEYLLRQGRRHTAQTAVGGAVRIAQTNLVSAVLAPPLTLSGDWSSGELFRHLVCNLDKSLETVRSSAARLCDVDREQQELHIDSKDGARKIDRMKNP